MDAQRTWVGATARGPIGAMTMSGVRQDTSDLGLMEESPPETMVRRLAPDRARSMPKAPVKALTELAHGRYGVAGGVGFLLPPQIGAIPPGRGPGVRRRDVARLRAGAGTPAGPAPLQGRVVDRAAMVTDHALHGYVVGR